eukprot:gene35142-42564_t
MATHQGDITADELSLEAWLQSNGLHSNVFPKLLELGVRSLSQILESSDEETLKICEQLNGVSKVKFAIVCDHAKKQQKKRHNDSGNAFADESGVSSDEQKCDEDNDRGAKRPRHERESFDSQHVDQIAGEVETGMRL